MFFREGFSSKKNTCAILIMGLTMAFGHVSSIKIEDKCRIVRSLLQQYQTQCAFLLKPKYEQDMAMDLLSFKYLNELSRMFIISSTIEENWKISHSTEMCQPFLLSFHNVSHIDKILKPFTDTTYRANTKWLIFEDSIENENVFFNNTYIPLDTEFLLAQQSPENREMVISEMYHILPNMTLRKQTVGQWHPERGLTWTNKSYSQRRKNFHGAELKAAFVPFGKIIFIKEQEDGKAIKFGGFLYQIWETLQNGLNFTTKIQRITQGGFGVQDANGTWTGMTAMLQRKQIHIGLMTLMMSTTRLSVLDYFIPEIKSSISIFIKRTQSEDNTLDQLLKPLSDTLWVGVGCIILLASVLLTVAWFFSDRDLHQSTETKYTISNSLFYVFGIFCQTAHGLASNSWSTRLVIINTNAIGFIVYGAYSAMLFSFLAIRKYEIPFNSIKDLMDDGRYKLGLLVNSAHFLVFTESKDPIIMEAYKKLVLAEKSHPTRIEDGMRRVCERKHYAYMMLKFFEKEIRPDLGLSCTYVALPHFSVPATLGIGCNKNSPLKRVINYHILKLYEGGLVKLFDERLIPLRFRAPAEEDVTIEASLQKVTTIFIIFLTGIIASIVILLVEIGYHRLQNYQLNSKKRK